MCVKYFEYNNNQNGEKYMEVTKEEFQRDVIETEGEVVEVLGNTNFKVKIMNNHIITAYISGKLRTHFIKVLVGDKVKVEMSPYDLTKGRIVWRDKN